MAEDQEIFSFNFARDDLQLMFRVVTEKLGECHKANLNGRLTDATKNEAALMGRMLEDIALTFAKALS